MQHKEDVNFHSFAESACTVDWGVHVLYKGSRRMKSETTQINRRSFAVKGLSIAGAVFGASVFSRPSLAQAYRFNPEHRRPVEITIHDLEEVSSHSRSDGRERERYGNAIRHLHEFGERLHEGGGFDKGKL